MLTQIDLIRKAQAVHERIRASAGVTTSNTTLRDAPIPASEDIQPPVDNAVRAEETPTPTPRKRGRRVKTDG